MEDVGKCKIMYLLFSWLLVSNIYAFEKVKHKLTCKPTINYFQSLLKLSKHSKNESHSVWHAIRYRKGETYHRGGVKFCQKLRSQHVPRLGSLGYALDEYSKCDYNLAWKLPRILVWLKWRPDNDRGNVQLIPLLRICHNMDCWLDIMWINAYLASS